MNCEILRLFIVFVWDAALTPSIRVFGSFNEGAVKILSITWLCTLLKFETLLRPDDEKKEGRKGFHERLWLIKLCSASSVWWWVIVIIINGMRKIDGDCGLHEEWRCLFVSNVLLCMTGWHENRNTLKFILHVKYKIGT